MRYLCAKSLIFFPHEKCRQAWNWDTHRYILSVAFVIWFSRDFQAKKTKYYGSINVFRIPIDIENEKKCLWHFFLLCCSEPFFVKSITIFVHAMNYLESCFGYDALWKMKVIFFKNWNHLPSISGRLTNTILIISCHRQILWFINGHKFKTLNFFWRLTAKEFFLMHFFCTWCFKVGGVYL